MSWLNVSKAGKRWAKRCPNGSIHVALLLVMVSGCARSGFDLRQESAPPFEPVTAVQILGDPAGVTDLALLEETAFAIAWTELREPGGRAPDGNADLLTGTIRGTTSPRGRLFHKIGSSFTTGDFVAGHPFDASPHGISIVPNDLVQGASAVSLSATSSPCQVLIWDDGAASYRDVAALPANPTLSGGASPNAYASTFLDYDQDGDFDLFRLVGEPVGDPPLANQLFTNVAPDPGAWTFRLEAAGEASAGESFREVRGAAIADVDGDGRVDIAATGREAGLSLNRTTSADTPAFERYAPNGASFDFHGPVTGELLHGVSVLDYDNDGDLDFVFSGWSGNPVRLFENRLRPTGTFSLVNVPIEQTASDNKAAAYPADYDNDGDLDFYIPAGPGDNILYRNDLVDPDGEETDIATFTPLTVGASVLTGRRSYVASWYDHDDDGDLDLMVGNLGTGLTLIRNAYYESGGQNRYYRLRLSADGRYPPPGYKVQVVYGDYQQLQEVLPIVGFGTVPYPDLHFGVGRYHSVEVRIYAPGTPHDGVPVAVFQRQTCVQPRCTDTVTLP